ncbi:Tad domain-containing protein [Arthrobacter sp. CC3]|uniref:Tad domain-containing protein n=1 Tax=Arthrobacter sp. CC3 TaxID=3029185 RepID=UPI00326368B5
MRRLTALRSGKGRHIDGTRTSGPDERGAVTVFVALLLVVLMGFAAIAVDVGAMYAEKAQLQNGADSSALAIAGDCANGSCGDVNATGALLANANSNDSSSGVSSITFPSATTVRVETNTRDAGSGANSFSLFFARIMGFETTDIRAVAEATWGAPGAATTLPWTVSKCVFEKFLTASQLHELNTTGNFTGDPIPTRILLRYDQNVPTFPGCAAQNGYAPGGFGWLDTDSGCTADIDIANSEVGSNPGNDLPNVCHDLPSTIMKDPVLIPIFSTAVKNGQKTKYSLVGFLAFQVTGFKFGGGPTLTNLDPLAPACNGGNCRGIQGYFTRFVSLDEGVSGGGGTPNYGASSVWLSK